MWPWIGDTAMSRTVKITQNLEGKVLAAHKKMGFLSEAELIRRGMSALEKELGPIEASRFTSLLINTAAGDSVKESQGQYAKASPMGKKRQIKRLQPAKRSRKK